MKTESNTISTIEKELIPFFESRDNIANRFLANEISYAEYDDGVGNLVTTLSSRNPTAGRAVSTVVTLLHSGELLSGIERRKLRSLYNASWEAHNKWMVRYVQKNLSTMVRQVGAALEAHEVPEIESKG